jgi:hypothetical protein
MPDGCPGRLSGGAIAAHWITFLSMFTCTLFLGYSSWTAKGPSSKQRYFAGYNEVRPYLIRKEFQFKKLLAMKFTARILLHY